MRIADASPDHEMHALIKAADETTSALWTVAAWLAQVANVANKNEILDEHDRYQKARK